MNTVRLLTLADSIERQTIPVTLNMLNVIIPDGLPVSAVQQDQNIQACAGGWACLLFGQPGSSIALNHAQSLLSLDPQEARNLFYGHWLKNIPLKDITRLQVIQIIRQMVKNHHLKPPASIVSTETP